MKTDSPNLKYTKPGWQVLTALSFAMCALATSIAAAETVLWQENFDDGNGDNRWFADQGVWQIGSPTVGPQTNAAGSSGTLQVIWPDLRCEPVKRAWNRCEVCMT